MANSLFNGYGNPLDAYGGQQNFQNTVANIAANLRNQGLNPEQVAKQLLNSGQMNQQQFNKFRGIANLLTGMHL